MTATTQRNRPDALAVLELLARREPPRRFEELLQRARRNGTSVKDMEKLDRAVRLGLDIHDLFGRAQQREAGLTALVDNARQLTHSRDQDDLLKEVVRRAQRLLHVDMAYIGLHDADDGTMTIRASEGDTTALNVGLRVRRSTGLGTAVLAERAPFWTPDYLVDERIEHSEEIDDVVEAEGIRAIMAVPLQCCGSVIGTLYGADREVRHFRPDEISLMCSLADLAAVAIEQTAELAEARAEVRELERDTSRTRTVLTTEQQLEAVHSRLIGLVLDGRDLHTIAEEAAVAMRSTVAVRDPGGRLLAAIGEPPRCDEAELAKCRLDAHAGGEPVPLGDGAWVAPVTAGGENLGTMLLVPEEPPVGPSGVRLISLVAQAVALTLLLERSTAVAAGQVRDELLDELLAGPRRPWRQVEERARRLSINVDDSHVVVVARPEGGSQGRAVVWASSYAHRKQGLKSVHDGCITLLLPGDDANTAARAIHDELSPLLGHPITIGAAGPTSGFDNVRQIHREAQYCLQALTDLGSTGCIATPQEMGFLGVLLSDTFDIEDYIRSVIGAVLDYDTERFTDLTHTLDAYFAAGGSPRHAARSLHVHPNTVSRRLERITELLGPEWQKPDRALEIQLALRLNHTRRMLRDRRSTVRQADNPGITTGSPNSLS
ncbi:helix-turn-helix domain-containing protein [Streptomyces sp. YGL11-2]|uniref:helix-turn-helix domain-containing protein n=1 Tax=Streptomyces sp. YGL11-2 TaxID=3414028 RepID=UPI003CF4322D